MAEDYNDGGYLAPEMGIAEVNRDEPTTTSPSTGGKASFASGAVAFPDDLGRSHFPDSVTFFFLDIVGADGNPNAVQGSETKPYDTSSIFQGDASKQGGVLSGKNNPTKYLNSVVDSAKSAGSTVNKALGDLVDPTKITSLADSAKGFLSSNTSYKTTGDIVSLPMPASLQYSSGAGWAAVNATKSGLGLIVDIATGETKFGDVMGYDISKMVSNLLYDQQGENVVSAATQKVFNPFVSQAFESMSRRQFRFDWTLTPKNEGELDNLQSIIQMFRYHMHPSMDPTSAFLRYPSQVDISFYSGEKNNDWLPKIVTCIIKDFSTNYTPNGQWTTNKAGAPYQYQLSLTVEEIVPLIKEDILKGF